MEILAIIPARKGSIRLPNKNKMLLCGKPLVAYAIEEAKKSKYINRIIVSTNDDDIRSIARDYEVYDYYRPDVYAQDDTPTNVVIQYIMMQLPIGYKPDIIVLLQPTSPLRKVDHIDKCIELYMTGKFDSVITVNEIAPHIYYPNGAVYVFKEDMYPENLGMVLMKPEESVDIDTQMDFDYAENICSKLQ